MLRRPIPRSNKLIPHVPWETIRINFIMPHLGHKSKSKHPGTSIMILAPQDSVCSLIWISLPPFPICPHSSTSLSIKFPVSFALNISSPFGLNKAQISSQKKTLWIVTSFSSVFHGDQKWIGCSHFSLSLSDSCLSLFLSKPPVCLKHMTMHPLHFLNINLQNYQLYFSFPRDFSNWFHFVIFLSILNIQISTLSNTLDPQFLDCFISNDCVFHLSSTTHPLVIFWTCHYKELKFPQNLEFRDYTSWQSKISGSLTSSFALQLFLPHKYFWHATFLIYQ